MLVLPLWFVTEHIHPTDPEQTPAKPLGPALVFTHIEKLAAFKMANPGGEWKMECADDREVLVIVIADLHRLGITALVVDPPSSGDGGEQSSLADLMTFCNSLAESGPR